MKAKGPIVWAIFPLKLTRVKPQVKLKKGVKHDRV